MNIKSILLGTAAGLMAVTGAQAADLPGEVVPAAVDYVKVCDTFGAGFFYIPGTETCLDISGRVRFRVTASTDEDTFGDPDGTGADQVQFRADARVDFDARTATEYGQLRSFFRINADSSDNSTTVDSAFIQLGWLTAGYAGTPVDVAVLHGINDNTFFDFQTVQLTVLADDLGGGFYAGASIFDPNGGAMRASFGDGDLDLDGDGIFGEPGEEGGDDMPGIAARIGIGDQPWGGIDLSAVFIQDVEWFAKLTGNLKLVDNFELRAAAAYVNWDDEVVGVGTEDDGYFVSLSAYYTASEAVGVYAGVVYDDNAYAQGVEERLFVNAGVDYTVTPGLVLTGEVNYSDSDAADDDNFTGIVQLTRNW
ncbi:porin [Chthonobacter albigriseus]|uniref:porin n=1 Tax=Chthonobacter albigriseus TaxID=1683161 RepID=UPI0015EF4964|nr:porin [Chthonobacter albigriseus]